MAIDWLTIKNEYINTDISQRKIAEKYNVSPNTVIKRANKEKWQQLKDEQYNKVTIAVQRKTEVKIINSEARKIDKILQANEQLLDKLLQAIPELSNGVVGNTTTVTTSQNGKVEKRTTKVDTKYATPVKVKDLNLLATALKNIQEINKPQSNAAQLDKLDMVLGKIEGAI